MADRDRDAFDRCAVTERACLASEPGDWPALVSFRAADSVRFSGMMCLTTIRDKGIVHTMALAVPGASHARELRAKRVETLEPIRERRPTASAPTRGTLRVGRERAILDARTDRFVHASLISMTARTNHVTAAAL
jgi:hypothetical protein